MHLGDYSCHILIAALLELCRLLEDSGLEVNETRSLLGSVRFPSVDARLLTEIQANPLAEQISESAYRAVGEDARHV